MSAPTPTQPDGSVPSGTAPGGAVPGGVAAGAVAAPPRRRGVSFKLVALAGMALFGVAAAVAWFAYERFLHYERVAALHIPPAAAWAVRIDVERVAMFEPVRKHLFPLLEGAAAAEAKNAGDKPSELLGALRREAGLNLGLDLREVVVAGGAGGEWVLVLGGLFPKRGDLSLRISQVLLRQAGLGVQFEPDSVLLLPGGAAFAQAADGCLLLSSSAQALRLALTPSQRFSELGLGRNEGTGGFAVLPRALSGLPGAAFGIGTLEDLERVRGVLEGEANGRLRVRVELSSKGPPQELAAEVQSGLQSLQMMLGFVSAADWGEARALIARAEVSVSPENTVLLSSFWERAEVDRACEVLSTWLGGQMRAM